MPEQRALNSGRRRRGNGNSSNATSSRGSGLVSFSVVEIREFERVVGDNPSCSSGVPVSIGWAHGKTFTMNLEDFEKARPPRRAQMDLVLTRGERHRLLVEWGASGQDVIEAIRMIIRVKNQRRQTVNNLGSYDRIEELFERVVRSAKKVICRSSSNTAARKLQQDSERAATLIRQKTSGQAASFTANETTLTTSTTTTPKRSQNEDTTNTTTTSTSNDEKKAKLQPPCKEVSVHKDFETCSHSEDAGEGDEEISSTKPPSKPANHQQPEEFPGEKTTHSTLSTDRAPSSSSADKDGSDGYDDVDDMSNPQSHDHHKEQLKEDEFPAATPTEKVNARTVDI